MTTVTKFYTETINEKVFYHVSVADIDNRGQIVTISLSKKEFDNAVRAFKLQKMMAEFTGHSSINKYF